MRYSTAPAVLVVASWLAPRADAFVAPRPSYANTQRGSARHHSNCALHQRHLSSTTGCGLVGINSAGRIRSLPRWKRRVAAMMNTEDGARWAPIPNVPNMPVSFVRVSAGSLSCCTSTINSHTNAISLVIIMFLHGTVSASFNSSGGKALIATIQVYFDRWESWNLPVTCKHTNCIERAKHVGS